MNRSHSFFFGEAGGGYAYLRGIRLLFLPIFPGALLIQRATLIRNSRVYKSVLGKPTSPKLERHLLMSQKIIPFADKSTPVTQ